MTGQATTEHSDGKGMPALPASARRLFASDREATVVTIDPDGTPQASLVWMALDRGSLVFGVEEHRRKVRNLRRDPRVTVIIHDNERTADGVADGLTQYLTVRGRATLLGPGIPDELTALMDTLARRYLGTDVYPFGNRGSETGMIVRIAVERIGGVGPWVD
ncbi:MULTISPECIES: TIGR03618 family F420-dependent PPOX class oxidoreductase [Protofrankia]|nr:MULTISPECIES: TIGR03618 family F420-dependent PPOX class oxidoreductase [Protofrankia]